MHKILYLDKTKRNRTGESEEKKTTKKCRIASDRRQEKGLHMAKASKNCCGNDTGESDFLYQTET